MTDEATQNTDQHTPPSLGILLSPYVVPGRVLYAFALDITASAVLTTSVMALYSYYCFLLFLSS